MLVLEQLVGVDRGGSVYVTVGSGNSGTGGELVMSAGASSSVSVSLVS